MSNLVIRIEHLSKRYRLGEINNGALFQDIQTWIALKCGKEDPHSKIGVDKYSNSDDYFWALKDISLDIQQGDRVGIIGKNGAGKSTLLKLLSRITSPTEGIIKIKGKIASLLEVGTGFHGELTGRENIYLNGAILGMKKRRIGEKLDEIIAFSGIEQYIDTPVKRYSSGMYVRLAFAVAAHLDSDILIADEVLAVGDVEFQNKALGKMQDLSTGQGRTVLFVSHNMGAVQNLCNCGVMLEKGRITTSSDNIKELANFYLKGGKNEPSLKWTSDGSFCDPCFTPISIEVLPEENKCQKIKLVFEVKEVNPYMGFGLMFTDTYGNQLFSTEPQEAEFKICTGMNTLYCLLPYGIPAIPSYQIQLGSAIKNTRWIINPHENNVSLYVQRDTNIPIGIKWSQDR